jgi:hypothetical protein
MMSKTSSAVGPEVKSTPALTNPHTIPSPSPSSRITVFERHGCFCLRLRTHKCKHARHHTRSKTQPFTNHACKSSTRHAVEQRRPLPAQHPDATSAVEKVGFPGGPKRPLSRSTNPAGTHISKYSLRYLGLLEFSCSRDYDTRQNDDVVGGMWLFAIGLPSFFFFSSLFSPSYISFSSPSSYSRASCTTRFGRGVLGAG